MIKNILYIVNRYGLALIWIPIGIAIIMMVSYE